MDSIRLLELSKGLFLSIKSHNMEQQINERFIRFSSRIPYSKDIPLGDDVTVIIDGYNFIANNVKIETKDNQVLYCRFNLQPQILSRIINLNLCKTQNYSTKQ